MYACIYNYSSYIIDFLHAMHMCNYNYICSYICTHVCRHTRKHSICLTQAMASRNIHAPPACRALYVYVATYILYQVMH